jgi:signal transduction histidine kinase
MTPAEGRSPSTDFAGEEPHGPARAQALLSLLRLHWFIRLRWGIVCVAMVVLGAERLFLPPPNRPVQLALVLAVVAVANVVWMAVARFLHGRLEAVAGTDEEQSTDIAVIFANAQVAVDLLLLTLILRYTGGVESPLATFYLFHMVIGSLLLKAWQALVQAAWAILLYVILGVGELHGWISPHFTLLPSMSDLGLYREPHYVVSAFAVVACGIMGMLYFTLHIAQQLDERENQFRHAIEALRQSQTAIVDLQQRRSRFMQTAAHQLKTPLAVIQTLAGLILDEVMQGPAIRDACKKIVFRCREGITQVTELLTLARLQGAEPKRPATPTDVRALVLRLCQENRPLAEGKQIELTSSVPGEGDLTVEVDQADLRDCLANLVENAIKFTLGEGKVAVAAGRCTFDRPPPGVVGVPGLRGPHPEDSECVYVSVSDTGLGIDAATLQGSDGAGGKGSIFDAFRRGNQALAAGISGTGLGLSIVREVVEQAGGRIHVRSQPGQGSTFTVVIPSRRPTLGGVAVRTTRVSHVFIEPAVAEEGDSVSSQPVKLSLPE